MITVLDKTGLLELENVSMEEVVRFLARLGAHDLVEEEVGGSEWRSNNCEMRTRAAHLLQGREREIAHVLYGLDAVHNMAIV